jgi:DNA topoisomerase-1
VKRRHINQYIKEVMGHNFSAKDFRTWGGTLICACALARAANDLNGEKKVRKQQWVAAIKETAEALGNTPAVCRKSYVCPVLLTKFEKGSVIDHYFQNVNEVINYRGTTLHRAEKALLKFLKKEATR